MVRSKKTLEKLTEEVENCLLAAENIAVICGYLIEVHTVYNLRTNEQKRTAVAILSSGNSKRGSTLDVWEKLKNVTAKPEARGPLCSSHTSPHYTI